MYDPSILDERIKTAKKGVIPVLRVRLDEIVATHLEIPFDLAAELQHISQRMCRRPAVRRAANKHEPPSQEKIDEVRDFVIAFPNETYQAIGELFDLAGSEVSRIMHGKAWE